MRSQIAVQELLQTEWQQIRQKNPAFSLRAFAKRLGIAPTALSGILNGKRRVSGQYAQRLMDRLGLAPDRQAELLSLFARPTPRDFTQEQSTVHADQFHLVSDWYYFAILSLAETDDFDGTEAMICRRLSLSKSTVQRAVERLVRLGMLKRKRGKLAATGESYCSTDGVSSTAVRKGHYQNLDLARTSLDEDDLEVRDFTDMTMAIDPDKIPLARKLIRHFLSDLCDELEGPSKRDVYKICLQLFPVSKEP